MLRAVPQNAAFATGERLHCYTIRATRGARFFLG